MAERLRSSYEVVEDRLAEPQVAEEEPIQAPDPEVAEQSPPPPTGEAEPGIDDTPDAEVRYTDAEILGKRYPVRHMVHEIGNQHMRAVESVQAKWKNMLDTPGKFRLGLSRALAERRYNRQKAKFDAVDHLDDNSLLKKRRQAKLLKAEGKLTNAKSAYDGRRERMTRRVDAVGENTTQRREQYIAGLKNRREAALARRTLRHELRSEGASWLETRKIAQDIPKEHLDRVGKLAAIAAVSERGTKRPERTAQKAERKEARISKDITENRKRAQQYAEEAKRANATLEEIRTVNLPEARQNLQELREELDGIDDTDPAWQSISAQVSEAEQQVEMYETREIPYWQNVAEDNRQRVVTLTNEHTSLQSELRTHKESGAAASEAADNARRVAEQHRNERDAAVKEITINP